MSDRLLTDFPDVLKYRVQLSDIHAARGTRLLTLDKREAALEQTEKAVALMRQVLEREPENTSYQDKFQNLQITQAATQCSLGKFEDALPIFLEALPAYEKRIEQAPNNPFKRSNYSGLLANVALTYRELGQPALTANYMEQALDVDRALLADYPNPVVRQAIANKTDVLLEAYSQIDEPEKLAASVSTAESVVEAFLEDLNSNERLFNQLIFVSVRIGKVGTNAQSQQPASKVSTNGSARFWRRARTHAHGRQPAGTGSDERRRLEIGPRYL